MAQTPAVRRRRKAEEKITRTQARTNKKVRKAAFKRRVARQRSMRLAANKK